MISSIIQRLKKLETGLPDNCIPTFEEFVKEFNQWDELSKSLVCAYAECPELLETEKEKKEAEYLRRMGLVTKTFTVSELVGSCESDNVK